MATPAEGRTEMRRPQFDPDKQSKSYEDFMVGFLHRAPEDKPSPLGMVAESDVSSFVYCTLFGLGERVVHLIPSRIEWIERALLGSKFPAENTEFKRAAMMKAKALYHWLDADNELAFAAWRQARATQELSLFEPDNYAKDNVGTFGLDDQMGLCLLAGEHERGVATYQQLQPGKEPTAARATAPRDWGYLACRNQLHPALGEAEVLQAGRRMLRRWLDDPWLGRGQASRAAMWLKAVYWLPDQSLSAEQTLLKAYDDLPLVERPVFAVK